MSTLDSLIQRIRGEYNEMPGLSLTFEQACRLWQIDPATCQTVLDNLLKEHFLARSIHGSFVAREIDAPRRVPRKAALRPALSYPQRHRA